MRSVTVDGRPMISLDVREIRVGDTINGRPVLVTATDQAVYMRIMGEDGRALCDVAFPDGRGRVTVDPRDRPSPAGLAEVLAARYESR